MASREDQDSDSSQVIQTLKRVKLSSILIESATLLPAANRINCALALLDSRFDDEPLKLL
jgi:hypothetical protein